VESIFFKQLLLDTDMIIKIFGILDLIAAIIFGLSHYFHFIPRTMTFIIAGYLIVKGAIFLLSKDIASLIDVGCGLVILLSIFLSISHLLFIITLIFLVQKGIFSLVS
jgi:hypothetical protein